MRTAAFGFRYEPILKPGYLIAYRVSWNGEVIGEVAKVLGTRRNEWTWDAPNGGHGSCINRFVASENLRELAGRK